MTTGPLYPIPERHPSWVYQATVDGADIYVLEDSLRGDWLIQWGPGMTTFNLERSIKSITQGRECPSKQAVDFANSLLALTQ